MHIVGVVPILVMIGVIIVCIRYESDFLETLDSMLAMGLISFLITVIISFTGGILFTHDAFKEVKSAERTQLVALQDNSGVSGNFFLGAGHIDGQPVYTYMYEVEGKGYKVAQVKAGESYVNYCVGNPYIDKITYQFKPVILRFLFIDFYGTDTYIFVPEGTIQKDFNIDLQ
jgi:hypothetical protein